MELLAKIGFTQSYTYFTWRNVKWEIEEYFRELSDPAHLDYFRPNVWPNTPDILHETLQYGSRSTFIARLLLAAGLSANYGIYGPVFELQVRTAREAGSEEYLDSEKYEIKHWDLDRDDSLRHLIGRVNAIRREHPALQRDDTLRFHHIDNDMIVCWSKTAARDDGTNDVVLLVGEPRLLQRAVGLDRARSRRHWGSATTNRSPCTTSLPTRDTTGRGATTSCSSTPPPCRLTCSPCEHKPRPRHELLVPGRSHLRAARPRVRRQ